MQAIREVSYDSMMRGQVQQTNDGRAQTSSQKSTKLWPSKAIKKHQVEWTKDPPASKPASKPRTATTTGGDEAAMAQREEPDPDESVELHNDGQAYEVVGVGKPVLHYEEGSNIPQIRWKVKWPSSKKGRVHEWTKEPFHLISHTKYAQQAKSKYRKALEELEKQVAKSGRSPRATRQASLIAARHIRFASEEVMALR